MAIYTENHNRNWAHDKIGSPRLLNLALEIFCKFICIMKMYIKKKSIMSKCITFTVAEFCTVVKRHKSLYLAFVAATGYRVFLKFPASLKTLFMSVLLYLTYLLTQTFQRLSFSPNQSQYYKQILDIDLAQCDISKEFCLTCTRQGPVSHGIMFCHPKSSSL